MKYKHYLIALLIMPLIGFGCKSKSSDTNNTMDLTDQGGCKNGIITSEGTCVETEDNLTNALYKNVDAQVQVMDVVTNAHQGFVARPKAAGMYPGVIMIHEWWGLNENIKQMAKQLASEGYTVYAIDLYDGEVASESSDAGRLAGSVRSNPDAAVEKMRAAIAYLRESYGTNKIASLGWCFGGQQSLNLSLAEDLDATVIYYGSLVTTTEALASISGPVLGIFGAEDTSIPVQHVQEFESSLQTLGIAHDIHMYPGVGHAFANPSGGRYAQDEAIDAWEKTVLFLETTLNK